MIRIIDTEMRSFQVFIRVRSKQLEPFYYLLASKLPKRNSFPEKKGELGTKSLYSQLPMAHRYLKIEGDKIGNVFIFVNGKKL